MFYTINVHMGKIVTFFGGDSQVGVTMIAQSVSEVIGKANKSVLLILANSTFGNDFIKDNIEFSIDDIKTHINSNSLTEEDIENITVIYNGISILPGIKNIINLKFYGDDDLQQIVNLMRHRYDVIIIDGGCNVQYGLNISSLKYAESRYYIISQREKSIRRFNNVNEKILKPLGYKGKIIINSYLGNVGTYGKKEIEEILDEKVWFTVPAVDYGWMSEENKTTLLKNNKFADAINFIVKDIIGDTSVVNEKRMIFKW